ncbi:MAG: hypothetical protein EBZ48_07225 [Proteobacteria bacterium]|nr:hypothetical protein [Pseudomonadota bacterium]
MRPFFRYACETCAGGAVARYRAVLCAAVLAMVSLCFPQATSAEFLMRGLLTYVSTVQSGGVAAGPAAPLERHPYFSRTPLLVTDLTRLSSRMDSGTASVEVLPSNSGRLQYH